jgi:hypothetical protein
MWSSTDRENGMREGRYTEEQIGHALSQAEARMKAGDICRKLGSNEQT